MTTDTGRGYLMIGLLLQEELARHGSAPTRLQGDAVLRDDDGAIFGLQNLAAACAHHPRTKWRTIVADHVKRIVNSPVRLDIMDTLTMEEAHAGVHVKLHRLDAIPFPDSMRYARTISDELVEVLMYKSGDALLLLIDECVERLGLEELREIGLRNLIASPLGSRQVHKLGGGGEILMVRGHSGFTASRALALPDLLRRTVGRGEDVPLPYGALVGFPDRHTLGVHVLGHPNALRALTWLIHLGLEDHPGAAYPLSGGVHWWHDGHLEQVSGFFPEEPGALSGAEFCVVFEHVLGCSLEEAAVRLDEDFARERREAQRRRQQRSQRRPRRRR